MSLPHAGPVRWHRTHGSLLSVYRCLGSVNVCRARSYSVKAISRELEQQIDALKVCEVRLDEQDGKPIIVAKKDIASGGVVLSVPDSQWISVDAVRRSPIYSALDAEPAWVQLALYLISQSCSASDCWASWLQGGMSRRPVALWTADELKELEGTQVLGTATDYRSFFESKYKQLQSGTIPKLPADVQAACTLEAFVRAASVVRSHLFPPFTNKDPAIVPIADLATHSRRENTAWNVKSAGFLSKAKVLEVQAVRDIAAGEVISIDYAPGKVESQVALDFGAFDVMNPQQGYVLPLAIPEGDRCYDDKVDIAELQGMKEAQMFIIEAEKPPAEELLAYLRLMNIAGTDMFLMEGLFRNEAWGHMCEPVSEDNETALCRSMIAGCSAALSAYPTSLAEDIKKTVSIEVVPGSPMDIALRVRMAEKRILEDVRVWFEDRLKRIDSIEYYQERRLKRLGLINDDGESTFEDMVKINI